MGSSLTKKDLTFDKSLPFPEKIKDLSVTTPVLKKEAIHRLFKEAETLTVSTLLFGICVLLIELKDLNIQDYHQRRMALSFFRSYSKTNQSLVINLENLPLEMTVTKKIFDDMLTKWWNESKEISQIFLIPMKLTLQVLDVASYVKDNTIEINNRFIIYGGQPLDTSQKVCPLNIIIGRKAFGFSPNIPFSEEEPYVSRKHCMIGFSCPLDFYLVDYSKSLNTSIMIPRNRICILKPSMVIEIGLIHRCFIDWMEPFLDPPESEEDEDLVVRIDYVEKNTEKINPNKDSKVPMLKLRFFNGLIKNHLFTLKPRDKSDSFTIGRDPQNFIQIADSNVGVKCGEIIFHEKYGWILRASGSEEGDGIIQDKKNLLPENGNEMCVLAKCYEEVRDGKDSQKIKLAKEMLIRIGQTVFLTNFD